MKKVFVILSIFAITAIVFFNLNLTVVRVNDGILPLSNIEALASGESNNNQNRCKWKKMSCGVFSGSYEACLTTGDGNTCTCGQVTRDC